MIRKKIKKRGKLVDCGVRLKVHERRTVDFFLDMGDDVELVIPSYTVGRKNPDIIMYGKIWEMKAPESSNPNTLIKRLKCAAQQAENLIVDLRGLKGDESRAMKVVQSKFKKSRRLVRLLLITKDGELIKIEKC